MSQLPVPGRDTVYVWIGGDAGGRPAAAGRPLRRAAAALLGRPDAEFVVGHRPGGGPLVRFASDVDAAPGPAEVPASVSRTGGIIVVAVRAGGPVGVDVERCRPLPALGLAGRWYDPAEAAWLAGRPPSGRERDFLRLWTAKEAVGKALGVGLRDGGLRRRVPVPDGAGPLLRPVPGSPAVRVGHPCTGGDLVLAVAVAGTAGPVEVVVEETVGRDGQVVEAVQRAGHGVAAVRSASVDRTSLPVVVRGS
ncbi:4'-phosphopantetheinyl transferase family protein [Micromonospora thermarum]|uniref:4'-phosphopantetheinyl transferase superfamily protein n=1 Tax=Micromonospora thermarum TaxID=2720024 RepID=A0ABX0Z0K8_9ACTN|nr:4'-phosphopantetheinyl transferase superfamily protein [Micromonospora thermarum]NJP30909.1 4'-phosphopantetheinyl transferase superfamily protein [Micromonospora thermarum]